MGKVLLQVLKEFEHRERQNLCTINFSVTFAKTASVCNSTMEKCQDSLRPTFKKVQSHIQKGANPEKAARRGYETTCDFDVVNKRILIQLRVLTCISMSLAHILQRELYTMGNTNLLRREAEMTHLESFLWDLRCQELRSSPFGPALLFNSQLLRMEKSLRVLDPIKRSYLVVPTIRRGAPTENFPVWDNPIKAISNPQVVEKSNNRGARGHSVQEYEPMEPRLSTSLKQTRAWKPLLPVTP